MYISEGEDLLTSKLHEKNIKNV